MSQGSRHIAVIVFAILFSSIVPHIAEAQATTSPHQIGYFCPPYSQSIVEGGYYMFTPGTHCNYIAHDFPTVSIVRYGSVFRGAIGNSTYVIPHYLGGIATTSQPSDFPTSTPPPAQGDDMFTAIWQVPQGPSYAASEAAFISFFQDGSSTPPSNDYGFIRWKWGEAPGCTSNCNDNVLFLPGIEGSRLYSGATKLWDGSPVGINALMLDSNGQSMDPNIYTEDVIGTFNGWPIVGEVYDSFLSELAARKTNGEFADYAVIPYDWRLTIPDIVTKGYESVDGGIFYEKATSTPYIIQTLRRLAAGSRTGKVTIIAHSNGGLVAKELVSALGPDAPNLIDRIIFVAVPQLGTPQAIGALLHGYDTGIPSVLTPEDGRAFAQNAPMAYHLLPSNGYFASVQTPVVAFEPGIATQSFINSYGTSITTASGLDQFLRGSDGRTTPTKNDLDDPSVANGALLSNAQVLMQSIGASWTPPAGITVDEIAGIGEDTLTSITYKTIQECTDARVLNSRPICLAYKPKLSYDPDTVVDGDGTVVVPSALAMSTSSPDVKRWWVNLATYNDAHHPLSNLPYLEFLGVQHRNILAVPNLQTFLFDDLIGGGTSTIPLYVSAEQPRVVSGNRLRFVLHSPLVLSATDTSGNEIGPNVATIPGATYAQYGDVQVVTVPTSAAPTLHMHGTATGSFTLDIEQYSGEALIATTTFSGVPSATTTIASIAFPDGTVAGAGDLQLDYNGDGTIDTTLAPKQGATATLPTPTTSDLFALVRQAIQNLNAANKFKQQLLKQIDKLERTLSHDKELEEKQQEAEKHAKAHRPPVQTPQPQRTQQFNHLVDNLIRSLAQEKSHEHSQQVDLSTVIQLLEQIENQI